MCHNRRIAFFCSTFLCVLSCFVGCAQTEKLSPAPSIQENSAPADPAQERPIGTMKMALPSTGHREIAGNEEGAYYILPNPADFSERTLYYDYETRQIVFLSNQVEATNDEMNPGWLEDVFGGVTPLAVNGKYYVVKYGKPPLPAAKYEGSPTFLLEMQPNAADRKKLELPQGRLLKSNTAIAADGTELYLLTTRYDAKAMQINDVILCKTDFAARELVDIMSLGVEQDTHIVGVYPQGLVLQRTKVSPCATSLEKDEQLQHLSYTLCLYSLAEGSLIDTGFSWTQGELSFVLQDQFVYYVRTGTAELRSYDLLKKTETVVKNDFLVGSNTKERDAQIRLVGEIYDNRMTCVVQSADQTESYSFSLDTKECVPLTLAYSYNGGTVPVSIAAESEEYFLVNSGMEEVKYTVTGTDGLDDSFLSPTTVYSLIKKEDYWNSTPNYISFHNTIVENNESRLTD